MIQLLVILLLGLSILFCLILFYIFAKKIWSLTIMTDFLNVSHCYDFNHSKTVKGRIKWVFHKANEQNTAGTMDQKFIYIKWNLENWGLCLFWDGWGAAFPFTAIPNILKRSLFNFMKFFLSKLCLQNWKDRHACLLFKALNQTSSMAYFFLLKVSPLQCASLTISLWPGI